MQLGLHGVDQDRCGGWFGLCGCRCRDVADGRHGHDYQTGETDAGHYRFLSLHGNWNSFRLQNTPGAECIGSVASPCDAVQLSLQKADDWTSESALS
jgi:hypothetical protein